MPTNIMPSLTAFMNLLFGLPSSFFPCSSNLSLFLSKLFISKTANVSCSSDRFITGPIHPHHSQKEPQHHQLWYLTFASRLFLPVSKPTTKLPLTTFFYSFPFILAATPWSHITPESNLDRFNLLACIFWLLTLSIYSPPPSSLLFPVTLVLSGFFPLFFKPLPSPTFSLLCLRWECHLQTWWSTEICAYLSACPSAQQIRGGSQLIHLHIDSSVTPTTLLTTILKLQYNSNILLCQSRLLHTNHSSSLCIVSKTFLRSTKTQRGFFWPYVFFSRRFLKKKLHQLFLFQRQLSTFHPHHDKTPWTHYKSKSLPYFHLTFGRQP